MEDSNRYRTSDGGHHSSHDSYNSGASSSHHGSSSHGESSHHYSSGGSSHHSSGGHRRHSSGYSYYYDASAKKTVPENIAGQSSRSGAASSPSQHNAAEDQKRAAELKKRKIRAKKMKRYAAIGAVCIAISFVLSVLIISCINDILAINRSSDIIEVEIEEDKNGNIDTSDVIKALDSSKLVKNRLFCVLAAKFLGYTDKGYRSGVYSLTPAMGLENMLDSIKNKNSSAAKTATVTFPEGYTVNQILQSLEDNLVVSKEKMITAMKENDYSDDYDFIKWLDNKESRYYMLEGYFYPDTYEFYIGESADSVIRKFLDNFAHRWTENNDLLAADRRLSIDNVVVIASIIEKEATGADMRLVASVLLNRLENGMQFQCDSTMDYENVIASLAGSEYGLYSGKYNTYVCSALPVSPICNPGNAAIDAVLNAADTDYLYFYHDSENIIHMASTLSEHNDNMINYP